MGALRQGAGGETLVVAVQCPDGHANPVHATTCRVCGTHLTGQQPVEVPRPSLGVLRLANGDVVALESAIFAPWGAMTTKRHSNGEGRSGSSRRGVVS